MRRRSAVLIRVISGEICFWKREWLGSRFALANFLFNHTTTKRPARQLELSLVIGFPTQPTQIHSRKFSPSPPPGLRNNKTDELGSDVGKLFFEQRKIKNCKQ